MLLHISLTGPTPPKGTETSHRPRESTRSTRVARSLRTPVRTLVRVAKSKQPAGGHNKRARQTRRSRRAAVLSLFEGLHTIEKKSPKSPKKDRTVGVYYPRKLGRPQDVRHSHFERLSQLIIHQVFLQSNWNSGSPKLPLDTHLLKHHETPISPLLRFTSRVSIGLPSLGSRRGARRTPGAPV